MTDSIAVNTTVKESRFMAHVSKTMESVNQSESQLAAMSGIVPLIKACKAMVLVKVFRIRFF